MNMDSNRGTRSLAYILPSSSYVSKLFDLEFGKFDKLGRSSDLFVEDSLLLTESSYEHLTS